MGFLPKAGRGIRHHLGAVGDEEFDQLSREILDGGFWLNGLSRILTKISLSDMLRDEA